MKRLFFFLILFLLTQHALCQCTAYVDVAEFIPVYDISSEYFKKNKGYTFPEFFPKDSIISFAYKPFKKKNGNTLIWEKSFQNALTINIDSSYLFLKNYAHNVAKYQIEFEADDGRVFTYEQKLNHDKYQLPIVANFSNIMSSNSGKDTIQPKPISIRKFVFTAFLKNPKKNANLLLPIFEYH